MEKLGESLGCVVVIAFMLFGVVQIYAAYLGLGEALGPWWAIGLITASFVSRSSILIIIGAFLCAKNVWEWHWALAALFAAPGLAFVLPAFVADVMQLVTRRR